MPRQYEKKDCNATASLKQILEIKRGPLTGTCNLAYAEDNDQNSCSFDSGLYFGLPKDPESVVWLPYNSGISISDEPYIVRRGKPFKNCAGIWFSTECRGDSSKRLQDMRDYVGSMTEVRYLGRGTIIPDKVLKGLVWRLAD